MLRPPPFPREEIESDDSGSFGGLADVLEPDAELDFEGDDAVTSLRQLSPASVQSMRNPSLRQHHASPPMSVRGPISVRAPLSARPPVSVRAPIQVQDFAFADTVFSSGDLSDEPPPPSGPIFVNDPSSPHAHCVTPLAFPLPPAAAQVDLSTRMRVLAAHMRHAVRRSREEMSELWAGTAEIVAATGAPASFLQRTLTLWSCFQWSRADLARAAMIGIGVFIVAGTIGATTMDLGGPAAAGSEVRAGRTLEQHTAKKVVIRVKR